MSYYILPKNNNIVDIVPDIKTNNIVVYTSCSLYNFYDEGKNQLKCLMLDSFIINDNKDKYITTLATHIKNKLYNYSNNLNINSEINVLNNLCLLYKQRKTNLINLWGEEEYENIFIL